MRRLTVAISDIITAIHELFTHLEEGKEVECRGIQCPINTELEGTNLNAQKL